MSGVDAWGTMAGVDARFAALEQQIERSKQELLAVFRGELNAAITTQTRMLVLSQAVTVVSLGGLALVLARVV